jgi:hypothetical protein
MLQRLKKGDGVGKQGRLGVDGIVQHFGWTLPTQLRERKAQNPICLRKGLRSYWLSFSKLAPHAHLLRTLTGKEQRDGWIWEVHGIKKAAPSRGFPFALAALNFNDFATGIVPAVGADSMGKMLFAAVGADMQMGGLEGIVSAPAVAPTFGYFSFWERWHTNTP